MTGLDAKFLYSETPTAHMHTIKVVVFDVSAVDGGFSFDTFATLLGRRLDRLPPFRRRVVPVPWGLGHPVWVEDPDFDLRHHLLRHTLEAPGDHHRLAEVVAGFAGTPLRRDRPLWELLVVEGLAGGRLAVVVKIHHAVADGSAVVALLRNVVDGAADHAAAGPPGGGWRPEPLPSGPRLLGSAVRAQAVRARGLPALARQWTTQARASERRRRSLDPRPPVPMVHIPRTSFNVSLSARRTFAMTSLALEDLRLVRRATGTTLNDVYLTVCAGALRRYLADRDELPDRPLVASVPVSTDPDPTRLSGNRVDNLYVSIGTDVADPLARLRGIHAGASAAKDVRDVLGHDLLARRADVVPPQLYASVVRAWSRSHLADRVHPPLNVVLSNVAGPKERITFGPIGLESLYSVGPILEGIGLNITAWSYAGRLGVSLLGSPTSVPDPWPIVDALHTSLAELLLAVEEGWTVAPPSAVTAGAADVPGPTGGVTPGPGAARAGRPAPSGR
jgi:diacylglycerol O-acyltransferase